MQTSGNDAGYIPIILFESGMGGVFIEFGGDFMQLIDVRPCALYYSCSSELRAQMRRVNF